MKSNRLILLIIVSILICELNVSSAQIAFEKTYGGSDYEGVNFIQQTTDGGYLILGSTESLGASDQCYMIKTNAFGDTLWTKTYLDANWSTSGSAVQTFDNGFLIAGTALVGTGFVLYLIKTDSQGDTLWTRKYILGEDTYATGIIQTSDTCFLIAGSTINFSLGGDDDFGLLKIDTLGNVLWKKKYGGNNNDIPTFIKETTDGGIVVLGETKSFGAGDADIYLLKIDAVGDTLWSKTYGGQDGDHGFSLLETNDNGFIISGNTQSFGSGNFDMYLLRTDSTGGLIWSKSYGGPVGDQGRSILESPDGGFYIGASVGTVNDLGIAALIKVNDQGDTLWTKTYGGSNWEFPYFYSPTSDQGFAIAGTTKSYGAGLSDIYFIKTDSSGNSGCGMGNITNMIINPAFTLVTSPPTFQSNVALNTFNVNTMVGSGGTVSTICSTTNLLEVKNDLSIAICPNPSTGKFKLLFENSINSCIVNIVNSIGQNVYSENYFKTSEIEIEFVNHPVGIYFVNLFLNDSFSIKRLIIY